MNTVAEKIEYELLHSGQKRAYGDTLKEYLVKSDLPHDEVEKLCNAEFGCTLTRAQWQKENNSASNHFRTYYTLKKRSEGEYLYTTTFPFAD